MDAKALWELFRQTGSPEVYLLYKKALNQGDAPQGESVTHGETLCI